MRKGLYASLCMFAACSSHVAQRPTVPNSQDIMVAPVTAPPVQMSRAPLPPLQIRREKGITRYPVETTGVTIHCPIMRVCDIELQQGEIVLSKLVGDKRWWTPPGASGSKDVPTPHVGVKPTEKGIKTNLIIYTDRRTYEIELMEGGKGERIGFLYPDEQKHMRVEALPRTVKNEGYSISGDAPWRPIRAYDDGIRTVIELPAAVTVSEMPVLYVTANGRDELCNYAMVGNTITVGRLFTRAALVLGTGWHQQRVTITREQ